MARWIEVEAPANIAIIKYWGKRDENLILPLNDSVSLSINDLRAKTRIEVIEGEEIDFVSINGKSVQNLADSRFEKCFLEARKLLEENTSHVGSFSLKVESTTNFPVAAGLASSAAGFAAIAFALGKLFDFTNTEISRIARIGSGSACRSVGEGMVQWHCGENPNGWDCYSESIFPQSYWPELRAIILILNDNEKETGSTIGMNNTVSTSELLKQRVEGIPGRVERLIEAYEKKDFPEFANIVMTDSNQFHAVCMDTLPPLMYLTDTSRNVIRLVHRFNSDSIKAAYTFDAGPNACIYLEERNVSPFLQELSCTFTIGCEASSFLNFSANMCKDPSKGGYIKNIIVSKVGVGPKIISSSQHKT